MSYELSEQHQTPTFDLFEIMNKMETNYDTQSSRHRRGGAATQKKHVKEAMNQFAKFVGKCMHINDSYVLKHQELLKIFAAFKALHMRFMVMKKTIEGSLQSTFDQLNQSEPQLLDNNALDLLREKQEEIAHRMAIFNNETDKVTQEYVKSLGSESFEFASALDLLLLPNKFLAMYNEGTNNEIINSEDPEYISSNNEEWQIVYIYMHFLKNVGLYGLYKNPTNLDTNESLITILQSMDALPVNTENRGRLLMYSGSTAGLVGRARDNTKLCFTRLIDSTSTIKYIIKTHAHGESKDNERIEESRLNIEARWPLETLTSTIASAPRLVGHIMNTRHTKGGQVLFSKNVIEKLYALYSYTFRPVFKITNAQLNDKHSFELHLVTVSNRMEAMGHNEKASEILKTSNQLHHTNDEILIKEKGSMTDLKKYNTSVLNEMYANRFRNLCNNYDRKYFCFVIKDLSNSEKDEFERQIIPTLRGSAGDTVKLTADSRIERKNKRNHQYTGHSVISSYDIVTVNNKSKNFHIILHVPIRFNSKTVWTRDTETGEKIAYIETRNADISHSLELTTDIIQNVLKEYDDIANLKGSNNASVRDLNTKLHFGMYCFKRSGIHRAVENWRDHIDDITYNSSTTNEIKLKLAIGLRTLYDTVTTFSASGKNDKDKMYNIYESGRGYTWEEYNDLCLMATDILKPRENGGDGYVTLNPKVLIHEPLNTILTMNYMEVVLKELTGQEDVEWTLPPKNIRVLKKESSGDAFLYLFKNMTYILHNLQDSNNPSSMDISINKNDDQYNVTWWRYNSLNATEESVGVIGKYYEWMKTAVTSWKKNTNIDPIQVILQNAKQNQDTMHARIATTLLDFDSLTNITTGDDPNKDTTIEFKQALNTVIKEDGYTLVETILPTTTDDCRFFVNFLFTKLSEKTTNEPAFQYGVRCSHSLSDTNLNKLRDETRYLISDTSSIFTNTNVETNTTFNNLQNAYRNRVIGGMHELLIQLYTDNYILASQINSISPLSHFGQDLSIAVDSSMATCKQLFRIENPSFGSYKDGRLTDKEKPNELDLDHNDSPGERGDKLFEAANILNARYLEQIIHTASNADSQLKLNDLQKIAWFLFIQDHNKDMNLASNVHPKKDAIEYIEAISTQDPTFINAGDAKTVHAFYKKWQLEDQQKLIGTKTKAENETYFTYKIAADDEGKEPLTLTLTHSVVILKIDPQITYVSLDDAPPNYETKEYYVISRGEYGGCILERKPTEKFKYILHYGPLYEGDK